MTPDREALRAGAARTLVRAAERLLGDDFVALNAETFYERPGSPRWGWGRPRHPEFERMFFEDADSYRGSLQLIERYAEELRAIDAEDRGSTDPCWHNHLFSGLDGASLYWTLHERQPSRYVEIGSGYSTRFAARAKRDGGLPTEIVSIDPRPQTEIDQICDRVIRSPLEQLDQRLFRELGPSDVLVLDGSHRLLMANHLVVFFLEILPQLPDGVLVGMHDIYLPDDYGYVQLDKFWNEHYVLGTTLLAGASRYRVVLPCHFVASTTPLGDELHERWSSAAIDGVDPWGCMLWFEIVGQAAEGLGRGIDR